MFSTPCVEYGIKPHTPLPHIMAKKKFDHQGKGGSGRKASQAREKAARKRKGAQRKRHSAPCSNLKPGAGGKTVGSKVPKYRGW